jgi:hypothetical protein
MRPAVPAVLAAAALAVWLTGCSHPAKSPPPLVQPHPEVTVQAVVNGYAAPCAGAISTGDLPVRVIVRQHGKIVAARTVRYSTDHDRYRISLPAGTYTISASHSADPARTVTVSAGQVTTVDFPNRCL